MKPPKSRILVVDDDMRLRDLLLRYLSEQGFTVDAAHDAASMDRMLAAKSYEIIVLDLMLPGEDGLSICRRLRAAKSDVPIIMLTAKGDDVERIIGLEMGADDYLPKPFEPRELLARLRSILRRTKGERSSEVLRFGRLEIDADARQVRLDGEPCGLTSYQFAILLVLARRAGRVMSRDALMDLLKNERLEVFDRSIDVHVSRIRAVIEDDPKKPRRVITVRGAGYVFARAQQ
jgi:two-component system, OmpR family, phosphate regulon response regulator OmpR